MNKHKIVMITLLLVLLSGIMLVFFSSNKPTYSDEEIKVLAKNYCKDYEGIKSVSEQSMFGSSILCNKIAGKRLWWNTYEGKHIEPKGEIVKERITNGFNYIVPLIIFLVFIEMFVKPKLVAPGDKDV